jgi:DNA topoisomerase-1
MFNGNSKFMALVKTAEKISRTKPSDGLIHVSDQEPGYARKKWGKGFVYIDEENVKVNDTLELERIKNIKIPPNWNNVWICKSPNGYLQATGIDSKNRKQYLYHPDWQVYQQETKFKKIKEFAEALPTIREVTDKHTRKKKWPKEKVMALIVQILDETYIRIGNKIYQEEHGTFGLTTFRRKHVNFGTDEIIFSYKAKGNKYRKVQLKNRIFNRLVRQCSELPGYEVFRYLDSSGKTVPVTSQDVNGYIESISGNNFTSKTFRIWGGTVLAIKKFPEAREKKKKNKRLKFRTTLIRLVAKELGNTVAICEEYYIHPKVLKKTTEENFDPGKVPIKNHLPGMDKEELIALSILNQ